nr:uncharacterized protein LOC112797312 isoform X1 [Arachis hypogaea]
MQQGGGSDTEVTWEDEQNINKLGRLNNRFLLVPLLLLRSLRRSSSQVSSGLWPGSGLTNRPGIYFGLGLGHIEPGFIRPMNIPNKNSATMLRKVDSLKFHYNMLSFIIMII